ncbi:spore germination protein [Paenibacillus sp. 1P03SA]|uniref:spore germination protein n=1 Tax=Paenibacillus sp. 1P03SA TaxID=3132294 RepID=UPI0039A22128
MVSSFIPFPRPGYSELYQERLSRSLPFNILRTRQVTGDSVDIQHREFRIGEAGENGVKAALFYTEGLVENQGVDQFILQPIMTQMKSMRIEPGHTQEVMSLLEDYYITASGVQRAENMGLIIELLNSGSAILYLDGIDTALAVDLTGWKERAIEEPSSQGVIRGPKAGFTESIKTNLSLVRRRINDASLRFDGQKIGDVTKTSVVVAYISGIVNEDVLAELKRRLSLIETDSILESGYVEEFIQETAWSPFPTLYSSERPDVVAAQLLEGRVAVFVDGTPFVLVAPALFGEFFHSPEDYYNRADISSLLRLLRFVSFLIALLGPSIYIAITTFHQEMLPTDLLFSLASQREGVPFPALLEAYLMEITFEIIREAGIRMPRAIGQAVSIVGTLVIGQAAVDAGIVSAAMVIVVSITAISSFVIPAYNLSISVRILRFLFMLLAATFGLFGVSTGLILLALHLCHMSSFGIPYMAPFAPFQLNEQKDTLIRLPQWLLNKRPRLLSRNTWRQPPPGKNPAPRK